VAYKKKSTARDDRSSDSAQAQAKAPVLILGEELEYRVARLLLFMGFFVRRGCPIYTVAALDRATDLDVLALRYTESFGRELIIAECKSGQLGPLDRIFWLSGVRKFSQADRALLVRKGTKWNIKDFAKECGVEVLDLYRVVELEANFKITSSEWPGLTDRAFFEAVLPDWNSVLRSHRELWELYLTLTSEVRYEDFFPSINFLLYHLRLLTRSWKTNANSSFHRFLLSESISQLSVFLMRIAQHTFDLAEEDRRGYIEKGLRYGSVDAKFAERMMNSAFNLTRQAVLHYTNKVQDIDRKVFEVPVPPGTQEVLSIVSLILREYPRSLNLPQMCDLMLAEVFVKENRNKGWLRRVYPNHDLSARVEIVREYLKLLTQSGACPPDVLNVLALHSLDNGPKPPDQTPPSAEVAVRQGVSQQTLHLGGGESPEEVRQSSPSNPGDRGLDSGTEVPASSPPK
jgi:hypothetical protein